MNRPSNMFKRVHNTVMSMPMILGDTNLLLPLVLLPFGGNFFFDILTLVQNYILASHISGMHMSKQNNMHITKSRIENKRFPWKTKLESSKKYVRFLVEVQLA